MSYNFPISPAAGTLYAPAGGPSWRFLDGAWQQEAPAGYPSSIRFETVSQATAATIPADINAIELTGYYAAGDGGGALYKRVVSDPGHAGKIHSLDGAWWEISEQTVTPQMFGIKGDGVADDTLLLRGLFDRGGHIHFPAGTYKVTRIPHPSQPPATVALPSAGVGVIFVVPNNTRITGDGPDKSIILATFPHQVAGANLAASMVVIGHKTNFEAEGIWFKGDYPESPFVFIPSNNGNSFIAHAPAVINTTGSRQVIRNCRFSHIPGFYVGTSIVSYARLVDCQVQYCANGYNVSGEDILVQGCSFFWSEGVESAGMAVVDDETGRITVSDCVFNEVSTAASLGGNIGVGQPSYSYAFTGNVVRNAVYDSATSVGVVIANNANNALVSGNYISGIFSCGIRATSAGVVGTAPYSPSIVGNTVILTRLASKGIDFRLEAGRSAHAHGNVVHVPNDSDAFFLTSEGTVYVSGNQTAGRRACSFTTGTTATLYWDFEGNRHFGNDLARDASLFGNTAGISGGFIIPYTRRTAVQPTMVLTALADVTRIAGAGSETDDASGVVWGRQFDGKHWWGDVAGATPPDTNLYRSAANVLKTDDKLITTIGLGVGNSAAATAVGTLSKKMEVFDAAGTSLGFVPIYTTIT